MATLTVYPEAGNPASNACDGGIRNTSGTSFAAAHDASTGDAIDVANGGTAAGGLTAYLDCTTSSSGGTWYVCRAVVNFDTSALTSGATVTAAVMSFVSAGKANPQSTSVTLVLNTVTSHTEYATSDFGSFGTTRQASDVALSAITDDDSTYNDFTLTLLSGINKTGISHYGVRDIHDVDNDYSGSGLNYVNFRSADNAGTSKDPKLVITYDEAAASGQPLIKRLATVPHLAGSLRFRTI